MIPQPRRPVPVWTAILVLGLLFSAACDPQAALTRKRIKAVEKGLLRPVFLKGLAPEKASLAERLGFFRVPGVSITVIDRNAVEWARAYGVKDDQTRQPLTIETIFQGGALGQMIAGAAVVALEGNGVLRLDDDARGLLRTWRFPTDLEPPIGPVPVRDLLAHAAGLSDQVLQGYGPEEPRPTLVQMLAGEKPASNGPLWVPARRSSAARTRYSEAGYVVLEQLLTDVTGKPFDVLARDTVLGPAGMGGTTFESPLPESLKARAATGHLRDGRPVQGQWQAFPAKAAKGLWTTPSDYASFLIDLVRSAAGEEGRILPSAAARRMLSPQAESFGLGFLIGGSGDDIEFKARGQTRGYSFAAVLFPVLQRGAVVMTNSDNGGVLIDEILCALAGAYEWPRYHPEEKPVLRLAPETYQQFVGRYEVRPDYILDVTWEDYYLVIRPTGQAATKFYAEGQTLFYSTDPYVRIQFLREKGPVDGLVLWQQDFELEARKVQ